MNLVRLRLWYQPADIHSSLDEVMNYAKQIKSADEQFLLDFHYSDTWADPGKQYTPAAWSGLNLAQLEDSIYAYSNRVIIDLRNQNTLPDIVQIGNEVNSGILWNTGKLNWSSDSSWAHFCSLLKQAIAGVKAADTSNHIKIMIHFAGYDGATTFFTHLQQQQVPFDLIGLSYYSFWDGNDLAAFKNALNVLSNTFQKKIMIVETAYPWTFQYNDYTNNIISSATPLTPGFPATQQGQYQFMDTLKKIILNVDGNRGIGFCYWAPDDVAFNGPNSANGSAWENMTLFDFKNEALPAVKAYGK